MCPPSVPGKFSMKCPSPSPSHALPWSPQPQPVLCTHQASASLCVQREPSALPTRMGFLTRDQFSCTNFQGEKKCTSSKKIGYLGSCPARRFPAGLEKNLVHPALQQGAGGEVTFAHPFPSSVLCAGRLRGHRRGDMEPAQENRTRAIPSSFLSRGQLLCVPFPKLHVGHHLDRKDCVSDPRVYQGLLTPREGVRFCTNGSPQPSSLGSTEMVIFKFWEEG